ncbi:TPM domain-containing protein [Ructibacterium gallinarum]|uniref:TPM domain-containing protein n=1 Tax=Ructibacterium gallinarum TaxID=2779355 RepID=A0A9D5M2U0_9FIRM|nr:TPM domain-containing protein [Ructibacterium gallinarum]MBE5039644.1 TPM domain-containing protein [Ructibacterium gallinarum]
MKRILWILLCSYLIHLSVFADVAQEPPRLFYAADFAGVLSNETENFIVEQSAALAETTGAQIVAVTVSDLNGRDVMDYGLDILRSWQVGSEKNNGIVILVSTGDRKIGVNVGYGLEGVLNDAKIGRLIDVCAIPALNENNYDTGIYQLYNALLSEVYQEYGLTVPQNVQSLADYEKNSKEEEEPGAGVIIGVLILVFLLSFFTRHMGPPGGGGRYYRRRGFYGGYFGGGGFGSSSGGGFGGFSGGGGSGGGGGASRGF